jgi:polynucleotide 5'-hydroxyl-kinase GRC3/NOL9
VVTETIPEEWLPGIDALRGLPDGGTALLVGSTDRGKTTFAALAARTLADAVSGRVAVVDADIGQSEIGPPGTVGLAWARPDLVKLHDLKPAGVYFVGAFAPNPAVLELVVATGQAVAAARNAGAKRILVDTTGFVAGPAARRLKVSKAQTVRPDLIIALSRNGELDSLLTAMRAATGAAILGLDVPATVGRKTQNVRSTRRLTRMASALEGTREIALPLAEVATVGATLGSGEPLPPELVRWSANALRFPVVHAEKGDGSLTLFLDGPPPRPGWEEGNGFVADHFGVRTLRVLSLRQHEGVLVGLHEEGGRLRAIGRFLGFDAERKEMRIAAPPPAAPELIRLAAFGRVRIGADGAFVSDVRPGEI